jgi:hypothetical protein
VGGFATLHTAIPTDVGDCKDNITYAANGDGVQHTAKGVLVWSKAQNVSSFSNGSETWVLGTSGVQKVASAAAPPAASEPKPASGQGVFNWGWLGLLGLLGLVDRERVRRAFGERHRTAREPRERTAAQSYEDGPRHREPVVTSTPTSEDNPVPGVHQAEIEPTVQWHRQAG